MMSNVLAATYPEQIAAVSLYSGVAAGCFVSSSGGVDSWNSSCANGQSTATAEAWGTIARNMYVKKLSGFHFPPFQHARPQRPYGNLGPGT